VEIDRLYEPERYELLEDARYRFDFDRRDFFRLVGLGLVVVGFAAPQESGRRGTARPRPQEIGPWLHVGEDGVVTAYTGKAEVGQNTRTALSQGVAEELRVGVDRVRFVMADTDRSPYDRGTFGSRSMPDMLPQVRKAAAAAREVLISRAGSMLSVDRTGLQTLDGAVVSAASGKSLRYGDIVKGQKLFESAAIGEAPLTPPAEWKVMGRPAKKVDGRDFVTGAHRYTTDQKLPGMLQGAVVRPASWGATLAAVDSTAVSGVTVVRDKNFLGVAAPDRISAQRAANALKAEWQTKPQPSDAELFAILKNTAKPRTESTKGVIEEGLAAADQKLSASYTVAYIAHAPLEPRAAVAHWDQGRLTVWTGTQVPFGVQGELASAFGIPESQVRVIVPDTGSGYGGKHTGEAAVEAARLAKDAGKPVKLIWTREDEFNWAYARPAGVIEVHSGVKRDGTLTAWDFHNYNSGNSGIATLYNVPNQRVHFHPSESPLRQGSYRGLAATANHFAREVHMDEVAHSLKIDPLEFRLANLKDPRLRAVFQRGADVFRWGKGKAGSGRGFGFGGGFEKGGYVSTFAEVSADRDLKRVKVERVVIAFECGAIVSPDCLRNQIEGGLIQGLGGALFEQLQFADGKLTNGRFSRYRVPRFADMPVIESVMVNRTDLASAGAGETPIVGIAPAIGNAIFSATGVRLRSMPLLGSSAAKA
jgi:nicotinate dehydrogenase subunit B